MRRISQGYVKIPDNWCTGGLDKDITYEPCGAPSGPSHLGWLWALLAVAVVCALCLFADVTKLLSAVTDAAEFATQLFRDSGYHRPAQQFESDFDLEDDPHADDMVLEDMQDLVAMDNGAAPSAAPPPPPSLQPPTTAAAPAPPTVAAATPAPAPVAAPAAAAAPAPAPQPASQAPPTAPPDDDEDFLL